MGRWGQRVPSSAPTPCPVAHLEGANPSRAPGLRSAPSCPCCCGQAGTFRAQPDREIHSIFWFQSYRLSCPPLATGHHGCTLVSGDPSWPSLLPLRPVQQAEFRPMLPYLDSQFVRSLYGGASALPPARGRVFSPAPNSPPLQGESLLCACCPSPSRQHQGDGRWGTRPGPTPPASLGHLDPLSASSLVYRGSDAAEGAGRPLDK